MSDASKAILFTKVISLSHWRLIFYHRYLTINMNTKCPTTTSEMDFFILLNHLIGLLRMIIYFRYMMHETSP